MSEHIQRLPGELLREHGPAALEWAASYLERLPELRVLAQVAPGEIAAALPDRAPEQGEPFGAVLRDLDEILMPGVTHWQHPRYFAYFPSRGCEQAMLAELLAAVLNSVAILWRTSPASTELERVVCGWVADLLGLPEGWHGHIEDTASTANMAALIAAREATGRNLVVASDQAHSSIDKAVRMLGMRLRKVPSDDEHRMRVDQLGDLSDTAAIVATVGTTASTAVDDVGALAKARASAGSDGAGANGEVNRGANGGGAVRPWLHVDAAYAGSAMVCPEFRWAFSGVEHADSLVVNPHKWMLTPMDCSLLYCSRPEDLRAAFSLVPEYLRTPDAEDALSLSEYGPALGRRFRSLKLWTMLRCVGRAGLQAHIRHGVALASQLEQWVREEPGWEVCAPRHFSLVAFRHEGDDEHNRVLLETVNASGEMFISHAVLNGRYTLRLVVGGVQTTLEDIRAAWDLLRLTVAELARQPVTRWRAC